MVRMFVAESIRIGSKVPSTNLTLKIGTENQEFIWNLDEQPLRALPHSITDPPKSNHNHFYHVHGSVATIKRRYQIFAKYKGYFTHVFERM